MRCRLFLAGGKAREETVGAARQGRSTLARRIEMKKSVTAFAVLALAGAASGQTITIGPFPLQGSQEVPANASPAIGMATLMLNTTTGAFNLDYSFSGLTGNLTVSHFHRNVVGVNGPVVYWLAANGAPNALPTTLMSPPIPASVTGATGSGTGIFSATLIDDALNGRLYMNVHSTVFGGGELRGQVVPTPGALALVGVAGLVSLRRRRA